MEEAQIKQIIERQPLHGSALLDPRCKILLLVCIGFVSYFLAGEVVSLALMLVYGAFIALGNGGKWAVKMIVTYIIVVDDVADVFILNSAKNVHRLVAEVLPFFHDVLSGVELLRAAIRRVDDYLDICLRRLWNN